jgi:hypothetical protein
MVATLPVLAFIGYWLVRRRTRLDEVVELAEPVPVAARIVDTERGRMQ